MASYQPSCSMSIDCSRSRQSARRSFLSRLLTDAGICTATSTETDPEFTSMRENMCEHILIFSMRSDKQHCFFILLRILQPCPLVLDTESGSSLTRLPVMLRLTVFLSRLSCDTAYGGDSGADSSVLSVLIAVKANREGLSTQTWRSPPPGSCRFTWRFPAFRYVIPAILPRRTISTWSISPGLSPHTADPRVWLAE